MQVVFLCYLCFIRKAPTIQKTLQLKSKLSSLKGALGVLYTVSTFKHKKVNIIVPELVTGATLATAFIGYICLIKVI